MTIVKGSKQHKLKVVRYRPYLRMALSLAVVATVSLAALVGFETGHLTGMKEQDKAVNEIKSLQVALAESESNAASLQQRFANIELGAQVDRQANEDVRQEVIALKEQLAELEEENSFYKGLMAPSENKKGLTIGVVELTQTERPREFKYKIVMQQLATKHNLLKGNLAVKVLGSQGEAEQIYELGQLSKQYPGSSVKLRFKYFQTIAGDLTLPEGFEAEAIELVASSTGKNATTVTKRLGWLVQEI